MKIAVLVERDDNFKEVAALTMPVLKEYCERHGYTLIDSLNPKMDHDRGIIWHRIPHLLQHLNDFDWLVHVDADVMVTNLNVPLTEFTGISNVIVSCNSREDGSFHHNDGVMFIRGCDPGTEKLLRMCWDMKSETVLCMQDALEKLWAEERSTPKNPFHIWVTDQKRFNSFLYEEYGLPKATSGQWTKGDFMLHLPGITMKRRLEIIPTIEIIR